MKLKDYNYKKDKQVIVFLIITISISFLLAAIFKHVSEDIYHFMLGLIGLNGIFLLIYLILFILWILGKIFGVSERTIKQLDKTDFEKNKNYYRDILKINSPLVLGYIDNLELGSNKLIAELLYLKNKKIINITEDGIKKLENYEKEDLLECEKYFIDRICCNNLINDISRLKELVKEEAEKMQLVKIKKNLNNGNEEKMVLNYIGKFIRNNNSYTNYFIYYICKNC